MAERQDYPRATIPATSGYSGWIDKRGKAVVGVVTPASWTGASAIAVKGRLKAGVGEGVIYDDQGTQITLTADAGRFIRLDERLFQGVNELSFASDGQASTRELIIVLRDEDDLIGQGL